MIDTKALRSRVLDLAIQGKLTEQLESDGTAADLLHSLPKVSTKRAGLLKKNISCNIDYDVPDNWVLAKLGEISSYGDAPNKAVVSECDADTWILELEEIQAGGKLLTKKRVGNSTSIGEKTHFKAGQVLYSKLRPYLKKVLVADEDGICTPEMIAFDVYADIDPNYMVFCLINSYVDKAINDRSYGVKMPRVDAAFMVNLPIPIPPLAEQKRIVARVKEIFRLLDIIDAAQEQYAADAESLKAKLITLGIQGRLTEQLESDGTAEELYQQIQAEKQRLIKEGKIKREKPLPEISEDEIPFDIPKNWKFIRFGEIAQVISGTSYKKHEIASSGIRILRGGNIVGTDIVYADNDVFLPEQFYAEEKTIKTGDVVIVASTGSDKGIGRAGIVKTSDDSAQIGAFLRIIRAYVCETTDYTGLFFLSDQYTQHIRLQAKGTNINNIKESYITYMLFPLPPLAEQKRIVEKIEEIMPIISTI